MQEGYLVPLLLKLGVMASIASVLARSNTFKSMLMRENRTMNQRVVLALWLSIVFGVGVSIRVLGRPDYQPADLGLEGSLLAGIIGGYVTGLLSGIVISLPAMFHGEHPMMPLLAGVGVLGGLLRDFAPATEEVWRFSPFLDLNIYRFFKESKDYRRTAFHLVFLAGILVAEGFRHMFGLAPRVAGLPEPNALTTVIMYLATLFAVAIPLKIWNSTRYEKKFEEQERLLIVRALEASGGNQSQAARILRIGRDALRYKLKKHNLA